MPFDINYADYKKGSDILVLINTTYGGFTINDEILKERNSRAVANGDDEIADSYSVYRNDKYLLEIYAEIEYGEVDIGKYVNTSMNKYNIKSIKTTVIPNEAISANGWSYSEYDGIEGIVIDHGKIKLWKDIEESKQKLYNIKEICLDSNIPQEEKIQLIIRSI